MEKKKVIIWAFMFFLLLSPLVLAQNNDLLGWGKTYWGMTEDEVIKAIGEKAIKLIKKLKLKLFLFKKRIIIIKNFIISYN